MGDMVTIESCIVINLSNIHKVVSESLPHQPQISPDGSMAATVSQEKTCKVFDVVNFDMINMLKLEFVPVCCGWIFQRLAVCGKALHRRYNLPLL